MPTQTKKTPRGLLVRGVEPSVIKELRSRAAKQGISVEEAHRRLLRTALSPKPRLNFIEHLRNFPKGPEIEFPRDKSLPREVEF